MKSELDRQTIKKFVWLRSETYSYLKNNDD